MKVRTLVGDCRAVLPTLDADSFDCCVTSPPYWGLRDYGVEGQIGLEPTLDGYIEEMAAVGRELWRVLKPSGTFWLNLGSVYAGSGKGGGGSFAKDRAQYRTDSDGKRPIPFPRSARAPACDSDGRELPGSTAPDSSCPGRDDERQADSLSHHDRSLGNASSFQRSSFGDGSKAPDMSLLDSELRAELSRLSPKALSFLGYDPLAFDLGATASASPQRTLKYSDGAPQKTARASGRTFRASASRTLGMDASETAFDNPYEAFRKYLAIQSRNFKPKDLLLVPDLVAMALQAQGWFLRSEIVWSKPNPMPESVADRPTSSHEKIWLLTKNAKYFYDADAIREAMAASSVERLSQPNLANQAGSMRANGGAKTNGPMRAVGRIRGVPPRHASYESCDQSGLDDVGRGAGRNARNVWTVASQPFKGAHFATMPPTLVERCILAGCAVGGHVLDPFGGAGTTGLAADRLQRNATLIELNHAYIEICTDRIRGDSPLFAEIATE